MGDIVGAMRWKEWKYLHGEQNDQLYNLDEDPNEENDLAATNPDELEIMRNKYKEYENTVVIPQNGVFADESLTHDSEGNLITGWC
jgi:arylsulfatase A-like enzyme